MAFVLLSQSDSCGLYIPELECEIGASGLGGRFTTVEGILNAIKDQIVESSAVFHDSEDVDRKENIEKYGEMVQTEWGCWCP